MSLLRSRPLTALSRLTARLLMALTLLLAALGQPAPALAASAPAAPQGTCAIVINVADSGGGSLRDAVACAPPGTTVIFTAALAGLTITLLTGEIAITKTLTIDASAAPGLKIDGNNSSRIFNVTAGVPVTLTALILQRGVEPGLGGAVLAGVGSTLTLTGTQVLTNTSTGSGGGVYANGPLTLINSRFQNNTCTNSGCQGGGLYANGALVATNTEVISNTSTSHGAGAYANTATTLTSGRFERNTCTEAACSGGGLLAWTTLTLTGTEFISNTTVGNGGGAFVEETARLTNARFQGNTSTSTGSGGGLYAWGALTLTNTQVLTNTSPGHGGGVYANLAVTLTNGLFQGNTCSAGACQGGGLNTQSALILTGTEFISNTSVGYGGGAYVLSVATLINGRFERNTCTVVACQGGGLFANSTLALTGTQFISNTSANRGGGAIVAGAASLTNGRFQGNTCAAVGCFGGGLFVTSTLTLTGMQFISNTSVSHGGGAVAIGATTLTNGRFERNLCTAAGCAAGGLYANTTLTLTGTEFISNTSVTYGGGTYVAGAANLTNGRFQGNACTEWTCRGGGLFANSTLTLTGTQFISNTSLGNGGGVRVSNAAILTDGHFQGNTCTGGGCQGGGLNAQTTLTLTGTEFISNTSIGLGGGAYVDGAANLTNGRFERNACTAAGCQGGGLNTDTLILTGTQFISNTSVGHGGGAYAAGATTLTNGRFERNACTAAGCAGGGLYASSALTLTGTEFINNTSADFGGGAVVLGATTLTNGRFERNACTAVDCQGGGLNTGTLTLTGTEFISNTSLGHGGGLVVIDAANLTNGRFERNACSAADCSGGGLYANSTLTLTGTEFLSNTSALAGGGALSVDVMLVTNSHFQGNACTDSACLGGGLYPGARTTVLNSSFSANEAAGRGGGIGITETMQITLANVTLSDNLAVVSGGGLYVGGTGAAHLLNVTVADNQSAAGGGLRAVAGATVGVTNTLFSNNTGGNCDGQIDFGTNNLEWPGTSCATAGPTAGFISANPWLAALALNAPGTTLTHALLAASAARDAGHAATCAGPLVNNRDQRGIVRPIDGDNVVGAVCDIGAYEAAAPDWRLFIPIVTR